MAALLEERILLHKTLAGQSKIKTVRRDQGERLTQTLLLCPIRQAFVRKEIWSDIGVISTLMILWQKKVIYEVIQEHRVNEPKMKQNQKVCHLVCPNVFHCHNIL